MYIDELMQNVNRSVDTNISIEVNVSRMYIDESMRIVSSSRYKLDDKIGKLSWYTNETQHYILRIYEINNNLKTNL